MNASANQAEQAQAERKHIFAMNATPVFLDALRVLLQGERYNVTTTNFVPNSFDQIVALQPDLLMIDLAVGTEAGWKLLAQLRRPEATRDIPVIVFSTDENYLLEAESAPLAWGGNAFLHKPFNVEKLLAAVDRLIGAA